MTIAVLVAALAGAAWGAVADRIGARWPAHDDGLVRAVDWRTAATIVVGAAAFALHTSRFGDQPAAFAYLGVVIVVLVVLFATDLDQRLLPDLLTLPLVPYALVGFVLAIGPFVRTPQDLLLAAVAAVALPGVLFLVAIPFGAGAIGMGDLKLLFGLGLTLGLVRLAATVLIGAIAAAVGIIVLLAMRRITLRSFVPYGPFLIIGAIWAITVSTAA